MKANWRNFEIESRFVGEKNSSWDKDSADRHHEIKVTDTETGIFAKFDYWTSKAHPEIDSTYELYNAFECWLVDASFGQNNFEDFCREQGYDVPDGIYDSWRACKKANVKAKVMMGKDWQDVADEFREEVKI